ncbi:antirestriction protein ArdA [Kaistella sp. G5-32]|uniref:Antirestriction protein ArdA n=1 Tax=Kaistella gelatinilytica TaxID=2787636 RepID=A0ABS0FBW2_9FLAO|nr:antirestriction protein ArdA [Kaistella gelatinilytica]MBF8457140.1 antirestriction protein ArdA [Kaistella gelatinilytica]
MANVHLSLDEIQIYVGTYRKYSEGSIFGKWLKLSDYSDFHELQTAMRELHQGEEEPEFMFQDYENSALLEQIGLISECFISPQIYEVIEKIKSSDYSLEVIESFVDCFGIYDSLDDVLEKIEQSYNGEFDSDEDFVENLLIDTVSIPSDLPSYVYIDWTKTARDVMMDYSASNNYYFRNI